MAQKSTEGIFTLIAQDIYPRCEFENSECKITTAFPLD